MQFIPSTWAVFGAGVMLANPRAFDGYRAWQVDVRTVDGTTYLPEGWHRG